MRIYHSPKHKLRDAKQEINAGMIVEPFERPSRMAYILSELARRNFTDIIEPKDQGLEACLRIHDADYIAFLSSVFDEWKTISEAPEAFPFVWPTRRMQSAHIPRNLEGKLGYYCLSSDTGISEGTWEAALSSKDSAEAAARYLWCEQKSAFALCRPPGHHAARDQYGGYCFLNNAAIAAERLRMGGAQRVSILDIDFHHGNGTQEIFYHRDDVQFLSLHGDPLDCFPYFLGHTDEKGRDVGEGYTHNFPLPVGTAYPKWKAAHQNALALVESFAPDALIISLGVDTFENDPISAFQLKSEDFLDIGADIKRMKLPTLFVMEGGYAIDEIGVNTVNVIEGFEAA